MKEYSKPIVWHVALSSFLRRFTPALSRLRSAFQAANQAAKRDARDWKRVCRDIDDMGIEIRKPTFNAYLRDFHGIGEKTKDKGETT